MHNCLNCKVFIPLTRKFCNSSCSAIFNNLKRGRNWDKPKSTNGRKGFLSKKLICGPYSKVYFRQCNFCTKPFASQKPRGTTCSDICYLSTKRKNAAGTKRQFYKGILFDSGWEVKMASLLDQNNIEWVIPDKAILWLDDNQKEHKYFPDFYLPNLDQYLDPKNPIVIIKQKEKLEKVSKIINLIYGKPSEIMERLTGVEPA